MQEKTKKRWKKAAVVLAAIVGVYAILALFPRFDNFSGTNPMRVADGAKPILIAHGGGNKEFPDNTLEAFYNAYSVDSGAMMETDVSITKDGVVILSHDVRIDRKTNRTGYIIDWNYSDLIEQRVDFGYTNETTNQVLDEGAELEHFKSRLDDQEKYPTDVPGYPEGIPGRDKEVFLATTLEELITHFPNNKINVEIKQSGETGITAFYAVIELLKKYDAFDRVVLASFHSEIYNEFRMWQAANRSEHAEFMYSPGTQGATKYFVLHLLGLDVFFTDQVAVFQLPTEQLGFNLATKRLVRNAHRHNIAVHYWTVNDEEEMKLLIDNGADGIMTDYPTRLKAVLESYGS